MKTADLWIRGGLVWLVLTIAFGIYLGVTEQFNLMSAHAHTGLLGGVWPMIVSWLYGRRGDPDLTLAAGLQWLAWNLGAAGMVAAFYFFSTGNLALGNMLSFPGAMLVLGTAIWLAIGMWRRKA